MENKLVSGIYGLEIPVKSKKILFPNTPQLENKRIKHIEFFSADNLPKSPGNVTVISDTTNMYLTLVNRGSNTQIIEKLNVKSLNINGDRLFINKIIDFQKSFIEYTGAENQMGKSVFVVFYYDEPLAWSALNILNQRTVIRSLELKITGPKTYFAYDQDLIGKRVISMLLLFPEVTPKGDAGIALGNIKNKFITLSYKNTEYCYNVPLQIFYQSDLYYQIRLQGIKFDLQKSYITSLTTGANDLKTVFFNLVIDDNK